MKRTLKMFKKTASAVLVLAMVLSLFSGMTISVNAEQVNTITEFTDNFDSYVQEDDKIQSPSGWKSTFTATAGGSEDEGVIIKSAKVDEKHGTSVMILTPNKKGRTKIGPEFPAAGGSLNFKCGTGNLVELKYEVKVPGFPKNDKDNIADAETQANGAFYSMQMVSGESKLTIMTQQSMVKVQATTGDAVALRSSAPHTTDWVSYRVLYNPMTGKAEVYVNDEFCGGIMADAGLTSFNKILFQWGARDDKTYTGNEEHRKCYLDNVSLRAVNNFDLRKEAIIEKHFNDSLTFTTADADATKSSVYYYDTFAKAADVTFGNTAVSVTGDVKYAENGLLKILAGTGQKGKSARVDFNNIGLNITDTKYDKIVAEATVWNAEGSSNNVQTKFAVKYGGDKLKQNTHYTGGVGDNSNNMATLMVAQDTQNYIKSENLFTATTIDWSAKSGDCYNAFDKQGKTLYTPINLKIEFTDITTTSFTATYKVNDVIVHTESNTFPKDTDGTATSMTSINNLQIMNTVSSAESHALYVDNVRLVGYDYDANPVVTFARGAAAKETIDDRIAPADSDTIEIKLPDGATAPAAGNIVLTEAGSEAALNRGMVSNGDTYDEATQTYTLKLNGDTVLKGNTAYTLSVSEDVLGTGKNYTNTFSTGDGAVKISDVYIKDVEGSLGSSSSIISEFPEVGKKVVGYVEIANSTNTNYAGKILIAAYDDDGVLVDVAMTDVKDVKYGPGVAGTKSRMCPTDAITITDNHSKLKAFFWQDTITPLKACTELEEQAAEE